MDSGEFFKERSGYGRGFTMGAMLVSGSSLAGAFWGLRREAEAVALKRMKDEKKELSMVNCQLSREG